MDTWYIFRMPEGTPDLTYKALTAYIQAAYGGEDLRFGDHAAIGTTVEARYRPGTRYTTCVELYLYGTRIAKIQPDTVFFPVHGDAHIATSYWTAKVVTDNQVGGNVWRIRRRKADGRGAPTARGYAGLLVIDGDRDRPVEGYAYPVGNREAGPWCNHDGPDAIPGRMCECREIVPEDSDYSLRCRAALAQAACTNSTLTGSWSHLTSVSS